MTEVLTYEALKAKCENLEKQISHMNTQSLEGALKMADAIKELTARVNALAVENQALIEGLRCIYTTALIAQDSGSEILYSWDFSNQPAEEIEMWISGAKETDAALAAIQAQGVEKLADKLDAEIEQIMRGAFFYDEISSREAISKMVREFANELREGK